MKKIIIKSTLMVILFSLLSCGSKSDVAPSSNTALKSISPNGKEKDGAMQKSLDVWLEEEWSPTFKSDKNITKTKTEEFKLQDYVDKAEIYIKTLPKEHKDSHVEKVKHLPVIGE